MHLNVVNNNLPSKPVFNCRNFKIAPLFQRMFLALRSLWIKTVQEMTLWVLTPDPVQQSVGCCVIRLQAA